MAGVRLGVPPPLWVGGVAQGTQVRVGSGPLELCLHRVTSGIGWASAAAIWSNQPHEVVCRVARNGCGGRAPQARCSPPPRENSDCREETLVMSDSETWDCKAFRVSSISVA